MCSVFPMVIFFPGFNSNINLPGRDECGSAPTSPSVQLQDKNANNHAPHCPSPAPMENGNQIPNGYYYYFMCLYALWIDVEHL